MELRHLEHFVAVAEERHFTRAAKRVHVVQSALSSSIRAFERELGTPLFIRSRRQVELTDAGRALLPEARHALAAADAARAAVAGVRGLLRGSVSVGAGKAISTDFLPILARFSAKYPAIYVRLHQAGSLELAEAVRDGRLDFAPLGLSQRDYPGVKTISIESEPMVLACSPKHRLAGRTRVRLADLDGEPFVDLDLGWGIRLVTDRWFSDGEQDRRVAFTVNDVDALLELVGSDLGIAVVPRSTARRRTPVRFVSLGKSAPIWRTGVVIPTDRPLSFAAQRLLEMVLADAG